MAQGEDVVSHNALRLVLRTRQVRGVHHLVPEHRADEVLDGSAGLLLGQAAEDASGSGWRCVRTQLDFPAWSGFL